MLNSLLVLISALIVPPELYFLDRAEIIGSDLYAWRSDPRYTATILKININTFKGVYAYGFDEDIPDSLYEDGGKQFYVSENAPSANTLGHGWEWLQRDQLRSLNVSGNVVLLTARQNDSTKPLEVSEGFWAQLITPGKPNDGLSFVIPDSGGPNGGFAVDESCTNILVSGMAEKTTWISGTKNNFRSREIDPGGQYSLAWLVPGKSFVSIDGPQALVLTVNSVSGESRDITPKYRLLGRVSRVPEQNKCLVLVLESRGNYRILEISATGSVIDRPVNLTPASFRTIFQ